jgi:hypothetical protein
MKDPVGITSASNSDANVRLHLCTSTRRNCGDWASKLARKYNSDGFSPSDTVSAVMDPRNQEPSVRPSTITLKCSDYVCVVKFFTMLCEFRTPHSQIPLKEPAISPGQKEV